MLMNARPTWTGVHTVVQTPTEAFYVLVTAATDFRRTSKRVTVSSHGDLLQTAFLT